jgi:ribosomal protein S18 acetylase RimI-like enzyme
MKYELIPSTKSDRAAIYHLNKRCFKDLVERQFGAWDDAWQQDYFARKWDPAKFQKVITDGVLIGALSLQRHPDHIFISQLMIDPDYQRQGYGTAILLDILRSAEEQGLLVRLKVLHKNEAFVLYERLGFTTTGKTETHFLMEKTC